LAWPGKGIDTPAPVGPVHAGGRGLTLLPFAPLVTVAILLLPVGAGLAGVIAPAFGWFPALGGTALTLDPWRALMAWPGLSGAVWLSITTGLGATLISLIITLLICAAWQGTRAFALIEQALSPLLSVPHAAAAFGLAFLIAPSGWISRAFSPWLTGWTQAPDILITQDPNGFALMAGLIVKEVPFLLLMTLAALNQVPARRSVLMAQTMGYGRMAGWVLTVFPRIYPQIRLPVYAVLAYSCAVIDVALILGPTRPSTLAVQVLQWLSDPNLGLRFQAAAGAVLQLGLVLGLLLIWRGGEHVIARLGCACVRMGQRMPRDGMMRTLSMGLALITALAVGFGILGLAVWSFAGFWSFPNLLPDQFTLRSWMRQSGGLSRIAMETLLIGVAATMISLSLTIACLEAEHRHGLRQSNRALWLLYLPLIVPQATFLIGLQTLAIGSGLTGMRAAVIAAHVVFVLPYVFLSLSDPWRAWDARQGLVAASLGAGAGRILWRVRLPMLLRPVLTAAAVGFAVSVGQYLPTLLIGMGRVTTLTTEAVALSSGGDRRLIGVYALSQTVMPLIGFALALGLPALVWRNRRGMLDRG